MRTATRFLNSGLFLIISQLFLSHSCSHGRDLRIAGESGEDARVVGHSWSLESNGERKYRYILL